MRVKREEKRESDVEVAVEERLPFFWPFRQLRYAP